MSKVSGFRTAGFPATTSTWGGRAAELRALQPVWGGALCLRWPPYFCHWAGKMQTTSKVNFWKKLLETILQSFKRRMFQTFKLLLYKISKCLSQNFIAHRRVGERDTIPNFKDQNLQMCFVKTYKKLILESKLWSVFQDSVEHREVGPHLRMQTDLERQPAMCRASYVTVLLVLYSVTACVWATSKKMQWSDWSDLKNWAWKINK